MTGKVRLSIKGLHAGEESVNMETAADAEYFLRNGSHYILYEEEMEGFEKTSKNRIKLQKGRMELTRQGILGTHMVFEENSTHMTDYVTPYGKMLLGIHTKRLRTEEHEDFIHVIVEYVLEADKEPLSECKIELEIRERP